MLESQNGTTRLVSVIGHTKIEFLDFFCHDIQLLVLLSPYLFFISFLYLDLYVLCMCYGMVYR